MFNIKTILCPTDFSENSLAALDVAAEFAERFDAELHVLHVLPLLGASFDLATLGVPDMLPPMEDQRHEVLVELEDVVAKRVTEGFLPECEVRIGDPAETIDNFALEIGADLIVISTHGRTGWRHLVFGSVAEAVVRTAACPVLTVRALPTGATPSRKLKRPATKVSNETNVSQTAQAFAVS